MKYIWDCLDLFPNKIPIKRIQATIAINSTLPSNFSRIWNQSNLRICADGGANKVYDRYTLNFRDNTLKTPDYLVGDFDSVRNDVLEYYQKRGSKIVKIDDQDTTDLEKSYYLLSNFSIEVILNNSII